MATMATEDMVAMALIRLLSANPAVPKPAAEKECAFLGVNLRAVCRSTNSKCISNPYNTNSPSNINMFNIRNQSNINNNLRMSTEDRSYNKT